jgi:hypothetical protein
MFSEQLAIMLFLAAAHGAQPQAMAPPGPALEDGRQALIRGVKEPELVTALSRRAKRLGMQKHTPLLSQTMLAKSQ